MLIALDKSELIVARTKSDSEIKEIAHLPEIGTHMQPNPELIVAASPDVILQLSGRSEALTQTSNLRKFGLNTLCFDITNFDQLCSVMLRLGKLVGKPDEANAIVKGWCNRLEKLQAEAPGKGKKIYFESRSGNLLAAGQGNMVNAIINATGAQNSMAVPKKFVRINEEALLLANPDICLIQKGPMNPAPILPKNRAGFADLSCVKNNKMYIVEESLFSRPGPNSITAAETLANLIRQD